MTTTTIYTFQLNGPQEPLFCEGGFLKNGPQEPHFCEGGFLKKKMVHRKVTCKGS